MILTYLTGYLTLAALIVVLSIVQFGFFLVIGVLAIILAAVIAAVIALIMLGHSMFAARKSGGF